MPFTNETEEKQVERAVLVGLSCPGFNADQAADERTMDELRALAETAGAEAVAMTLQRRPAPDARTFIGEGKAEEVKALAEANDASLILFDNELSPSQMSNLEELTGRTVLDRSALILDIFAQRARTGEGKLQVELAQYQYILPRLAGMGKAMSRLGGGIGTRGPGEQQGRERPPSYSQPHRQAQTRSRAGAAGARGAAPPAQKDRAAHGRHRRLHERGQEYVDKHTLTGAGIEANDRLFDTLDPTTRQLSACPDTQAGAAVRHGRLYPRSCRIIWSRRSRRRSRSSPMPTCCCTSWMFPTRTGRCRRTVDKVIAQLGAQDIPRLMVYNKADKCDPDVIPFRADEGVKISAKTGEGVDALLAAIEKALGKGKHRVRLCIPYSDGAGARYAAPGGADRVHRLCCRGNGRRGGRGRQDLRQGFRLYHRQRVKEIS